MQPDTDSDLALAMALAETNHERSDDDDFQQSSQSLPLRQQFVLRNCENRTNSRHRKSRKRPKENTTGLLETLDSKGQKQKKTALEFRFEKEGKENRPKARDRYGQTGLLEKSLRSDGTKEKLQAFNCKKVPINREFLSKASSNDSGQLDTHDTVQCKEMREESVSLFNGPEFDVEEVVSLDEDEECSKKATSFDELKEDLSLDLASPHRPERRINDAVQKDDVHLLLEPLVTPKLSQCINVSPTNSPASMVDRIELNMSVTGSIASHKFNNGSQFSALLNLCSDLATDENEALKRNPRLASMNSQQPLQSSFLGLSEYGADKVDTSGLSEPEDEDVMRLMTQVRTQPGIERLEGSRARERWLQLNETYECQNEGRERSSLSCDSPRNEWKETGAMEKPAVPGCHSELPPEGDEYDDENFIGRECIESDLLLNCPICEASFSEMSYEQREHHLNTCLDKIDQEAESGLETNASKGVDSVSAANVDPVLQLLERLNLSRYANVFIQEEIDWDTLKLLTEEDLIALGITALGPRRKIIHSLQELRIETRVLNNVDANVRKSGEDNDNQNDLNALGKKLITDFFILPPNVSRKPLEVATSKASSCKERTSSFSKVGARKSAPQLSGIPHWMSIPGTSFRVDAFQYLRGDCSHWFLTHFHTDHYKGLTRGFRYGHVYCSSITARLVNVRIGVPWERLKPLPLNEKANIDGVNVTFLDANHCPGSVMILFELPNGKAVLHTGDFRFSEEMANNPLLQRSHVDTLILDTTYCDPQYDFPKQETVIQFVIDAIQAEAFNPKTLFLIGTYTIGKERIFLEVARVLQQKVYVGAAKFHLLECMNLTKEDMQWLSTDEDSHIHVVPLWTVSSFKRMSFISRHYQGRYNSIVAFSPTGWSYRRGKKRTPGRRWQQGTLIRYEVPYSEHCSFKELQEFVRFMAPLDILPSVYSGKVEADAMVALLLNEEAN